MLIVLALGGAVVAAIIGTFWYSDKTPMGKIHMRYIGFDTLSEAEKKQKMEEVKPKMAKMYISQMILSFLTAFAVVFIVIMSMRNGLSLGLTMTFVIMNWLCFMVPVVGSSIIWGNCDPKIAWKKFWSDSASNLVTVLVIGYLASLFV